jgi:spore coat protein W
MKGAFLMSDSPQNPPLPNKLIELLVNDIFKKNGINMDNVKEKISEDQKQALHEMVKDLSEQVDKFVNPPSSNKDFKNEENA